MKRKIFTTLCLLSLLADAFASSVSTNKTFMLNDGTGGTTDNALPPNETNFFNANYGWLDMAAIPPGGVFGSEEWIVSQLDPPGIYVDSVLGSDSNPGTETLPLQHLAAVTALLGGNSTVATNIYLKRGSKFYESFVVPTNAFVCDYSIGVKPIITGVTNLNNAGFTLTAGKTNTYQLPLIVPIETNVFAGNLVQSNVLMVWQANQRLGARWDQNASYNNNTNTAINSVDGNPNSFFYDLTNHVLYLNTSTNGNPATNGLIYEASIRTLALVGSSNCTVSNIIGEKCYARDNGGNEGYGILGEYSGTFINCIGRHGWNHCVGFAPPLGYVGTNTFIGCYGWDIESNITYTAAGSVFVADASSATNTTATPACGIFSNCLAVATPLGLASADSGEFTIGYFGHLLTNLVVQLYGCVASNCYYGYGGGQTNFTVETNCVAVNCFNGVETINPADAIDHFYAYNCTNGVIAQAGTTNLIVNNSQFWEMNSAGIWGRTTTNMFMTNDIFASTNTLGTGIESSFGPVPVWSYSNQFYQLSQAYAGGIFTNLSGANTADYNNYYGNTKIAGNQVPSPGFATTFVNWQSMWPSADPHGTTSNPNYPVGDFACNVNPPTPDTNSVVNVPSWIAVQNGGGLTNLQGTNLSGNVIAPANLYVVKTNFANYEQVTNSILFNNGGSIYSELGSALVIDPTGTPADQVQIGLGGNAHLEAYDVTASGATGFYGSAFNDANGYLVFNANKNLYVQNTNFANYGVFTNSVTGSNFTATAVGASSGFNGNALGLTNGLPSMCGCTAAPTIGTTTYYFAPVGSFATSAGESTAQGYVTRSGTVSNFYVHVTSTVGAGSNIVFTMNHNGSPTTVTCTTTSSANRVSDTSHSFTVAVGDTISITAAPTGSIGSETFIFTWAIQ